jgi:hypothetical protein
MNNVALSWRMDNLQRYHAYTEFTDENGTRGKAVVFSTGDRDEFFRRYRAVTLTVAEAPPDRVLTPDERTKHTTMCVNELRAHIDECDEMFHWNRNNAMAVELYRQRAGELRQILVERGEKANILWFADRFGSLVVKEGPTPLGRVERDDGTR